MLIENPKLTYDELAEKMNKTRETVRTNLRTLEEKKLVKRIGADKAFLHSLSNIPYVIFFTNH